MQLMQSNWSKDIRKSIKQRALAELLASHAANGGKKKQGDIQYIVDQYNKEGYKFVTRRSFDTFFKNLKKGMDVLSPNCERREDTNAVEETPMIQVALSDLTDENNNIIGTGSELVMTNSDQFE
jgi:hypothetical protein